MRIVENEGADPRLPAVLREVEKSLSGVPQLAELTVNLVVEPTFDALSDSKYIRVSPALYQKSTKSILINASLFWAKPPDVQIAVLAHEAAHALFHLLGAKHDRECLEADMMAARWGFREPLARDRALLYGAAYAEALLRVGEDEDGEVRRSLNAALNARLYAWTVRAP
jgi:hypothetical protein